MSYGFKFVKINVTPLYVGLNSIIFLDITRRIITEKAKGHLDGGDMTTVEIEEANQKIKYLQGSHDNFTAYVPLTLMSISLMEAYYNMVRLSLYIYIYRT